jgi:hypothetical protein
VAALASLSDAVNRLTGGNSGTPETLFFHKVARYNGAAITAVPIAGRPYSLWMIDGHPSGATSAPGGWANPDNTTQGGLLQADPGGGRSKWLMQFMASGLVAGTLYLYDRLGHIGNLSGTTTTAQTFTGSLTRYTDGVGNFAMYEIYGNTTSILGATATTMTMSYTNQAGTSGRTSPAVVIGGTGFREGNQARFIPLAAGDTGIQSVENADLVATTGTAGAWGITVGHMLGSAIVDQAGVGGWRDFITGLPGIAEIKTDACLALLWEPSVTTAPEVHGIASFVEA